MRRRAENPSGGRARSPRRILAVTLAAWLVAAGAPFALLVSAQGVAEPQLKAAFLFNFVKFATWPEDLLPAGAPIVLCATDDDIAASLESLVAGRSVDSHALVVKRVKLNASARGCAVLYAGRIDQRRAKELFTALDGTSVLTVGDAEDFATAGGMIGLFVDGGRMRFAINIGAVERTQVRLSAQLLNLAKIIKG
ncbi:MAG TPA: YfiR family protein [Vicinamibacterales bacterium]|nr:YfiR family protein [Vicinamibacterales bacterium]